MHSQDQKHDFHQGMTSLAEPLILTFLITKKKNSTSLNFSETKVELTKTVVNLSSVPSSNHSVVEITLNLM